MKWHDNDNDSDTNDDFPKRKYSKWIDVVKRAILVIHNFPLFEASRSYHCFEWVVKGCVSE